MSSPKSNRVPLACRWTRFRAALTNNPAFARGHCATCADCWDYFAAADQLEANLRRQATATAPVPATLERRILNAVQHSPRAERRRPWQASWALGGLAAAAIAAVIVFRIQRTPPADAAPPVASIDDVLIVAQELPKQWFATLQPGAVRLLEANPLQEEIASVSADAQSALNFLALNFLPSNEKAFRASDPAAPPRQSS
ncbi:MAG TPA: hypothetical protein VL069_10160 [Opitutus sp.]|nr:hypothetical protein [Opitutus sp.]